MKNITIPELNEHFKTLHSDELILDVRTEGEYSEGHVPGAKNIPFDAVMNHVEELKKFKTLYVYCRAGRRATVACEVLGSLGFQNLVCVDEGGFPDWLEHGFKTSAGTKP